jgi:uncharacterized damage-inducible protein DinB
MLNHYHRLLEYDRWANAETVASLRGEAPPPRAVQWMAHIVGSQYTWLSRLREEPPPMPVWPELDVDGCAAGLAGLADLWRQVEADLSPEILSDSIGYRNSKGEFWTSTVADILSHMTLHSAYHRGQIAAAVRAAGGTPATTDFIHAARQGHLERHGV